MMRPTLLLICVYAYWTIAVDAEFLDLYEGDICKEVEGIKWTCKKLRFCPKAQADMRMGRRFDNCNFDGAEVTLCCEPDIGPQPIGTKSKEMCKKYAENVYVETPIPCEEPNKINNTCLTRVPLISEGRDAKPLEYPHMALIGYGNQNAIEWLCGGSLISERFVLSAAHCTDAGEKGLARWVRLGEYDIRSDSDDREGKAQPVEIEIIERINHFLYRADHPYYDITLYKLKSNVEFNKYIRPICLQTERQFPDSYAIATGWGYTEWGMKRADILQEVNLTITDIKECNDAYLTERKLPNGLLHASMLCAGDPEKGRDTCQGDSGGPLQIRLPDPGMYSQVGITSHGPACGGSKPGIYTRVSNYVPWIERIVWPN